MKSNFFVDANWFKLQFLRDNHCVFVEDFENVEEWQNSLHPDLTISLPKIKEYDIALVRYALSTLCIELSEFENSWGQYQSTLKTDMNFAQFIDLSLKTPKKKK